MANLNEIETFTDPVDCWAAEREFTLRYERWALRNSNTLSGAMIRLQEAWRDLLLVCARALVPSGDTS